MQPSTLPPPKSGWERFKPFRRTAEIGYWVIAFLVSAIGNSATAMMDIRRTGLHFDAWEPAAWEWTSALMVLMLVPALVWYTRRVPLQFERWRQVVSLHVLGSLAWSVLHVAGMVAMRKVIYAMQGMHYDFGAWPREFGYEYLKDIRSYFGAVVVIEIYRWFLLRLQGEASVLAQTEGLPAAASPQRPERFLVRKLGKEFLLNASDVEWLQASGNYMNLHVRGRIYPLRSTMSTIETQLDPARFVRVHRSHIVNLDCVAEIQPLDTGDARIVMRDGSQVPCSRRYRDALRPAT